MSISKEGIANIAKVLTEAMPYIRKFHNSTPVIKLGGSTMADTALMDTFARDLVLLKLVGINPVVVHGGGPQISAALDKLNIKTEFVDGVRVTDAATMECVEMILGGQINQAIVTRINQNGGNAVGITGKDGGLIKARKFRSKQADSNKPALDFGQVGEVVRIERKILDVMLGSGFIPIIAPIGYDEQGGSYNINADLAAGAVAAALQANKLILLTDTAGVLDEQGQPFAVLSSPQVKELIGKGEIHGGMLPKIDCALAAVQQNVRQVHIIDGRMPHALLVEMLTDEGVGTLIKAAV